MGVYAVLDEALGRYRRELKDEDCRIALAWRFGWKRNKDGQLVLGKCQKVNELSKEYADFDFIIVFNHEAWKELDGEQRLALMHHELCHAEVATDPSGNTKKDAKNRTCFRIRKHDVEEFGSVINAHGCYKQDLENFVASAMHSKKPPSPSLLDTVLEEEDRGPTPEEAAAKLQEGMPEGVTVEVVKAAARKTPKRPPVKARGQARKKTRERVR